MPFVGLLTFQGSFHTSIPSLDKNWPTIPELDLIQNLQRPDLVYTTVPFQDMDAIYFLYTDQERNVVKYNLTTKSHSIVKGSKSVYKIPFVKSKTRIGKFYWILGDNVIAFRCQEIFVVIRSKFGSLLHRM